MERSQENTGKNYINRDFYKKNPDLKEEFDIINSYIDQFKNKESQPRTNGQWQRIKEEIIIFLKWLETKLFSLAFVIGAAAIIYYSNFFKVIFENNKVDWFYLHLSILFYTISVGFMFYLTIYLPFAENIHENDWNTKCPSIIPIISFFGFFGMVFMIVAVWNVWGWLSIPMLLIMKLGLVLTHHFLPGGTIGSYILIFIVMGAIMSSSFIEHDGYLH